MPQFKALMTLATEATAMPISELADQLDMSLATAGRNVERLVQMNLVIRREDENDRRIKRVSLSDAGAQVVTEQMDAKERLIRDFCEQLPAHLRNDLFHALDPILRGSYLGTAACMTSRSETASSQSKKENS